MKQGGLILAAGRVRSKTKKTKKKPEKIAPPQTHHEIHSSPATETTPRRRAAKDVASVSPYPPASIDPGFVEIGFVQLSQSVKTANVIHAHTDRQTSYIMSPCTYPDMKNLFCLKAKTAWVASLPRSSSL